MRWTSLTSNWKKKLAKIRTGSLQAVLDPDIVAAAPVQVDLLIHAVPATLLLLIHPTQDLRALDPVLSEAILTNGQLATLLRNEEVFPVLVGPRIESIVQGIDTIIESAKDQNLDHHIVLAPPPDDTIAQQLTIAALSATHQQQRFPKLLLVWQRKRQANPLEATVPIERLSLKIIWI